MPALHLWRDKVHLNEYGLNVLTNNFINMLNDGRYSAWQEIGPYTSAVKILPERFIQNEYFETKLPAQHDSLETNDRGKEVNHQEVSELLNIIRVKNINNIIVADLNINTFKNKYDFLKPLISENIDVMIIGETKLDDSFPNSQFLSKGFAEPFKQKWWGHSNLCSRFHSL